MINKTYFNVCLWLFASQVGLKASQNVLILLTRLFMKMFVHRFIRLDPPCVAVDKHYFWYGWHADGGGG